MCMLDYNWLPVFMTGLGTMFLIGEILVKTKGILFLLGAGFISTFFISYLDPLQYGTCFRCILSGCY